MVYSNSTQQCRAWFIKFCNEYGDQMPTNGQIHLPSTLTKHDVYMHMKDEFELRNEDVCALATFYKFWCVEFKHIVIPEENRFAKCSKCTRIKFELHKTNQKQKRQILMMKREKHLRKQNIERRKYYKHMQKARQNPNKYLSIIIDGMDQSKTDLPSFACESKETSKMWKLATHVTGVLVHGRHGHCFIDLKQFPHDSNLTCNIILTVLSEIQPLPPVLYLQLDNSGKDNKNRFVFALCALLVELKIFRKIKIGFLMVGHTHEDIDQLFSCVAKYLNKYRASTLDHRRSAVENSYKKLPITSSIISYLHDIKNWLVPYMQDIRYHSKPHQFKFVLAQTGKCIMSYKNWSTDCTWCECAREMDTLPYLLKESPADIPVLCTPDFSNADIPKLKKSLASVANFLRIEERDWWEEFLNNIEEITEGNEQRFLLHDIIFNDNNASPMREESDGNETDISDSDNENEIRPVHIGKFSKRKPPQQLDVGAMVATALRRYPTEWPQIGKIFSINNNEVEVVWYTGTYTSRFVLCEKDGQEWREIISKEEVISIFNLTPTSRLPTNVIVKLKELRDDFLNES
ncbi:uncharacterized protein [Antedon mediterranea]|uniref:uncharacterized protein n=1 Tax=Antedon mediterranea TaxID=105859 RepID=UPI003AF73989